MVRFKPALFGIFFQLISLMLFIQAFSVCGIIRAYAANAVSASDLINLVNGMRTSYGLPALTVDYNIMACAQNTADTMAASGMSWHIGNTSGRIQTYGYNNGEKCQATENFMAGANGLSLAEIQAGWADSSHMLPMTNSNYCHIGAGVSGEVNGIVYYVVQVAYPASGSCGYSSVPGGNAAGNKKTSQTGNAAMTVDVSQIIRNVAIATADADGKIWHVAQDGQTLWSIATAYDTTIEDIASWNGITDTTALSLGKKILIPKKGSAREVPTATMVTLPTMDSDGKFRYTIAQGDTLWTISEKWKVPLASLLHVNGLNEDTVISLGWRLLIPVTATVTPLPSNTPLPSETPLPTNTAEAPTMAISGSVTPSPGGIESKENKTGQMNIILGIIAIMSVGSLILLCEWLFLGKKKTKKR